MPIRFYCLSGSPFAWKIWLALEYKGLKYELRMLSADRGELKSDEYLAINTRGKAPAIVHDGFALYESAAIIEYLEETFPYRGAPLWPDNLRLRALGRRLAAESDAYLYPQVRRLVEQLTLRGKDPADESVVLESSRSAGENLEAFAQALKGDYLLGNQPSAADFALYPLTAILVRLDARHSERMPASTIPAKLRNWRQRIESLAFFEKTWPPHWGPRSAMRFVSPIEEE